MDIIEAVALITCAITFCIVLGYICTRPIAWYIKRREERLEFEAGILQCGGYNRSKYRV